MQELFGGVAGSTGVALRRAAGEHGLGFGEWRPLLDAEGGWTGRVLIQAESADQIRRVHAAVHGRRVTVGDFSTTALMDSAHLGLGDEAAAPGGAR